MARVGKDVPCWDKRYHEAIDVWLAGSPCVRCCGINYGAGSFGSITVAQSLPESNSSLWYLHS